MSRSNLMLVHHSGAPALTSDHLTDADGETRVRGIDLAERLGFGQPRDIRKIIERKKAELSSYGVLSRHRRANHDRQGQEY